VFCLSEQTFFLRQIQDDTEVYVLTIVRSDTFATSKRIEYLHLNPSFWFHFSKTEHACRTRSLYDPCSWCTNV